jgi:hypothetical protein
MRILMACEESQVVCKAFRERGHEAYSNDIIDCSGDHPEWHLKMDVFEAIASRHWDMMIAFPPCTFLTVTGNKWFKPEYKNRFPEREREREDAIQFFLKLTRTGIKKWAIENPVGIMSTEYRKPNQIVHPYYFGHEEAKKTCFWLRGLPRLNGNLNRADLKFEPDYMVTKSGKRLPRWFGEPSFTKDRQKMRSRTFDNIASAMAAQWG